MKLANLIFGSLLILTATVGFLWASLLNAQALATFAEAEKEQARCGMNHFDACVLSVQLSLEASQAYNLSLTLFIVAGLVVSFGFFLTLTGLIEILRDRRFDRFYQIVPSPVL